MQHRASNRNPLLLAARQLERVLVELIAEPEALDQFAFVLRIETLAQRCLETDIIGDRQSRNQVELLKHEAQPFATHLGQG